MGILMMPIADDVSARLIQARQLKIGELTMLNENLLDRDGIVLDFEDVHPFTGRRIIYRREKI